MSRVGFYKVFLTIIYKRDNLELCTKGKLKDQDFKAKVVAEDES